MGRAQLDVEGRIALVDATFERIVGRPDHWLLGRSLIEVVDATARGGAATQLDALLSGRVDRLEVELRCATPNEEPVWTTTAITTRRVGGDAPPSFLVEMTDRTVRTLGEALKQRLETTDELTMLPTLARIRTVLQQEADAACAAGTCGAVLVLNVFGDGLIEAGDPSVDDALLVRVVAAIERALPSGAQLGRSGPAELTVVWPGGDQTEADVLAARLTHAVASLRFVDVLLQCGTASFGGAEAVSARRALARATASLSREAGAVEVGATSLAPPRPDESVATDAGADQAAVRA